MANELQAGYLTGRTLYVSILSGDRRWHTGQEAFEDLQVSNWTGYDVPLTEQSDGGLKTGTYFGDFPAEIPAGTYEIELREQMGGSPAYTDPIRPGSDRPFVWDGTAEVLPAAGVIPTAAANAAALLAATVTSPTAAPTAPYTVNKILGWLLALAKFRRTQTATTETVFADDGSTSIATSTKADDTVTFTRGEYS